MLIHHNNHPAPPPPPPRPPRLPLPPPPQIEVRSVWRENLESEFLIIRSIIDKYPVISMDTEFPGVVTRPIGKDPKHITDPSELYKYLKSNVDISNLIQIGLTFSDSNGNLPHLYSNKKRFYIWEFNFSDFDVSRDFHNPISIDLLRTQGIDFERNRKYGIESVKFAELMMSSGLVLNDSVSWISFHGGFDFGYLIKILTSKALPEKLETFLEVFKVFFGQGTFVDVKLLTEVCGLFGGLDRIGSQLGLKRVAGKSHQAGSDSLLTLHVFLKLKNVYGQMFLDRTANVFYGLEICR